MMPVFAGNGGRQFHFNFLVTDFEQIIPRRFFLNDTEAVNYLYLLRIGMLEER